MTTPPSSRRRILGTSLKLYFDLPKTLDFVSNLRSIAPLASSLNIDLFIIPDLTTLHPSATLLQSTPILLGAQDTFWQDSGPYTGEVSPLTLSQLGVKIVEIGHAERRRIFHETDEQVGLKAAAVVRNGMIPLVCIGERTPPGQIASQAVGQAVSECRTQINAMLAAVPDEAEVVLAYEPVWAIGAKEPAAADHVTAVVKQLRALFEGRKGGVRILYGGSAGPGTFEGLKWEDGVDGLFLGRFAHDIKNIETVLREMGKD